MDVYGVFHHCDHLAWIDPELKKSVSDEDIVGTEVYPRLDAIYKKVEQDTLVYKRRVGLLREIHEHTCQQERRRDDERNDWPFWEYWFHIRSVLLQKTNNIIPMGSDSRIDFLSAIERARSWGKAAPSEDTERQYNLVMGPHFNRYIVDGARQHGLTKLVVGIGHAPVVKTMLSARLHTQEALGAKMAADIQSLEDSYAEYDVDSLPDL